MARRITLLALFALVMLTGPGCCYMRSCFNQFRANHPCLFPCYNSAYPGGCGSCGTCGGCASGPAAYDGCATCYSGSPAAGQPYPAAIFGTPQPITNPTIDPKTGVPNPMK